ncbi:MAG: FAD-binding protein [Pseudomonadota bacterium]|nr:FAD-binding protein [Pseudomonadota bacterium]
MTDQNTSDVLVIGGGLAAICAAIAAAETGAAVIVANKGITGTSGSSAKAAGILAAAFGHGGLDEEPVDDSPAHHVADSLAVGHYLGAPELVTIMAEQACDAVNWLAQHGVAFSRTDSGKFIQLNAPGNSQPRACSAIGGGSAILQIMIDAARRLGVVFIDQLSAYKLLTKDGRVIGAAFCDTVGSPCNITAGAVVLCAGGATGLFPTVSGDTDNVGNGLVLGLQAGAALANLEFVEYTLIYRVNHQLLRIAGMAPFLSRGGRLLNDDGADLLVRHFADTPSKQIGRAEILRLVQTEISAGRGPVWLDCTDFSDAVWAEFETSQGDVILSKITAAGCNYRTQKIEVVPAAHSVLAGLVIDPQGATTLPGLFAAGENVTGIHGAGRLSGNGLTACVVMGRVAGKNASETAKTYTQPDAAPTVLSAADRLDTTRRKTWIDQMREAAGHGLGIIRNQSGITDARLVFAAIVNRLSPPYPLHPADHDILQMGILGQLMCDAAARRPESRGVQCREDATETDTKWAKWQIVTQSRDGRYVWTERWMG